MYTTKKKHLKRISTALLALLMVLALLPNVADAKVNAFLVSPPGGAGTGGGMAEAAPRGFGIDLNGTAPGGLEWLSSKYDNFNWCAVYTGVTNGLSDEIPAVDAEGNPIIYQMNAYVDRNPGTINGNTEANPKPFVLLYKDGALVDLSGNIEVNGASIPKVGAPIRGSADRAGNTMDPSGQGGRWTVPMSLSFEPGHTYEFAFAQGFICNNGVANMISADGTGYYQAISTDPANPERIYYEAHKYNESQYREYRYQTYKPSPTPGQQSVYTDADHINPTEGTLHPMRFTLKTKPKVDVTGVTFPSATAQVGVGSVVALTATVAPADATYKKVTWTSSDETVATVDTKGKVTGVKVGKATITATTVEGNFVATCEVDVTPVSATGITVDPKTAAVEVGRDTTLTAVVAPEMATNKKVAWTSSDESIATVDADGKVTGVKVGKATMTATTEDGGFKDTCEVTVTPVAVTGITLDAAATVGAGRSTTLTATVAPADAANKKVTWTSSDESIATVDANGKVSGIKIGQATITATTEEGHFTATCDLTVQPVSVTGIALATTATADVGGSTILSATVTPTDATNKKIKWASADETIATVDGNGKVTGIKAGKVTITATTEDGAFSASCDVTVKWVPATGIALNLTSTTVEVSKKVTLVATVAPDNATNKKVTWTSSDESIATVDANGTVTGVKAGKATITATVEGEPLAVVYEGGIPAIPAADGKISATAEVTVIASSVVPPADPSTPTAPGTVAKKDTTKPVKTGDNSLVASALMLLLAASVAGGTTLKRAKED